MSTIERLAYSPSEAAEALGVSRQHIYALIQRGELRTTTAGSRRLVPLSALVELLGESEVS